MSTNEILIRIAVALVLSSAIGFERELRRKPAGLRTLTLVGVGATVAMLVSKYGFDDIDDAGASVDPSRIASQIVSGVGFIGAGIIFIRRDAVSGLTTAAIVWLTAIVGMAVGAGMITLAVAATVAHFLVAVGYPVLVKRIPRSPWAPMSVSVRYRDNRGVLRDLLGELTSWGFSVSHLAVDRSSGEPGQVSINMEVSGRRSSANLAESIAEMDGVISVHIGEVDET